MSLRLTFLGAAGTVTGSKTLIDAPRARVLVDCGMFLGFKHLRMKNRAPLAVPPSSIDAVLLTHAHLDHCGWLPVLVREGFRGHVFCTEATRALVQILLLDAAHLEEEQARWLKKKQKSRHADPQPLFHRSEAEAAIARLKPAPWRHRLDVAPGLIATLTPAGHILGASSIHVADESDGASVVFSGDVGRDDDLLVRPPEPPAAADAVVLESTYGGRSHAQSRDAKAVLAEVIARTVGRGGILMVPAFSVGRAQALLHLIRQLFDEGTAPRVPVFLNSPMAAAVTDVTCRLAADLRLPSGDVTALANLAEVVGSTDESKALNERRGPMIVIAGSGMMTGGRILHHLAAWGSDAKNTILLAGYQAPGTRGALLLGGAQSLRLFGDDVPIRAELEKLEMLSGHADAAGLLAWVRRLPAPPRHILINHGEPDGADALRQRLEYDLAVPARVVLEHDVIDVSAAPPGESAWTPR